jgi:antitoxin MazE
MKMALVRIGNSRGLRLPKPIIEQCGFGETVEMRVERGRLIITPARRPREGWEEAFRAARRGEPDEILLEGLGENRFDREEWEW